MDNSNNRLVLKGVVPLVYEGKRSRSRNCIITLDELIRCNIKGAIDEPITTPYRLEIKGHFKHGRDMRQLANSVMAVLNEDGAIDACAECREMNLSQTINKREAPRFIVKIEIMED